MTCIRHQLIVVWRSFLCRCDQNLRDSFKLSLDSPSITSLVTFLTSASFLRSVSISYSRRAASDGVHHLRQEKSNSSRAQPQLVSQQPFAIQDSGEPGLGRERKRNLGWDVPGGAKSGTASEYILPGPVKYEINFREKPYPANNTSITTPVTMERPLIIEASFALSRWK